MARYPYAELVTPDMVAVLHDWLQVRGELYVWIERPHSGGGGVAYRIRTVRELKELLQQVEHPEVEVFVFRDDPLPVRGVANDALLQQALWLVPAGEWYSIVPLDNFYPEMLQHLGSGDNHSELEAELRAVYGREVAVGREPFDCPWDTQQVFRRQDVLYLSVRHNLVYSPGYHENPARYADILKGWSGG